MGLLGPNGAGKSTLMKILTGYYTQWEGKVDFFEKDLKTELRAIQKQVGYLTENNPLYPEMYVKETPLSAWTSPKFLATFSKTRLIVFLVKDTPFSSDFFWTCAPAF